MHYCLRFLAVCSIFLPSVVYGVAVSPERQSISVNSGGSETISIVVENNELQSVRVIPYLLGVVIDSETGVPQYTETVAQRAWVRVPDEVVLSAQESRELFFTIAPPSTALPGAYLFGLFVGASASDVSQIGAEAHVGALLDVYVAGDINEVLRVRDFRMAQDRQFSRQHTIAIELQNEGNMHLPVDARVSVLSSSGREIYATALNIDTVFVGMRRSAEFSVTLPAWYAGPVTVLVEGQYGATNKGIAQRIRTWYISPLTVTLGAGILLTTIVGGVALARSRRRIQIG